MKLDRSLIKTQAKAIIKGQVFALFLITLVVGMLTGGINAGITVGTNVAQEVADEIIGGDEDFDNNYFDDFTDDNGLPNLDYFNNFNGSVNLVAFPHATKNIITRIYSNFGGLLTLALAPLSVTLCGLYVMIIRGNKMKLEGFFQFVFGNTFNETYLKKLLVYLLQTIITTIMFCLLIIPGFIFYYRYYFAQMIINDNPNLSAKEALKLSTEMTKGHKGELFALDLSFIGWTLLCAITLGLASIYVIPYYNTTKALYYENFRIRCIQEQANPELKFMTAQEQANYYSVPQAPVEEPVVVEEPKDTFGSGMDNSYYNGNF